jgi:hypothetical protein
MSSPVGTYANFIDTQDVILDNLTDGDIYTQAKTIIPNITHDMVEHHLTTGFVEKLASLDSVTLPITAILTEPQLPPLLVLALDDDGRLPVKEWQIKYTSFSNNFTTLTGFAKLFNLRILDQGSDVVEVAFDLEFESKMAASAVQAVINVL